jgi:predicted dinucleotide-binding enzyme
MPTGNALRGDGVSAGMRIATIGRGNVGGGLAQLWRAAGHEVTELGRDGGDVSDADAVLVAVASAAIDDALASVTGLEGRVVLDATNVMGARAEGFESQAHQVKARANGPVAKAFNLNFARLYDEIPKQRVRPGSLFCCDDEARATAEQLISDAGFEPVYTGGLENARVHEDFLKPLFGISQDRGRQVFYRFALPGEL